MLQKFENVVIISEAGVGGAEVNCGSRLLLGPGLMSHAGLCVSVPAVCLAL